MEEGKKEKSLKREYSAGGVVHRLQNGNILWLVIKPHKTDRWQLQKGRIDGKESSKEAAKREVEEEGGVEVEVIKKIGEQKYFFVLGSQRILKSVVFYLMKYKGKKKEGHDWEGDEVKFLPYDKAYKSLTFNNDKEILKKVKEILGKGVQESLV